MRRAEAGILTPGGSEAMCIQLAVAEEVAQTRGGGGSGFGGRGRVHSFRLQRDNDTDAGGGTCHVREGTPHANPVCIPIMTLRAGDNTRDVLRNVALPNLGGSVWCKRWYHGGR